MTSWQGGNVIAPQPARSSHGKTLVGVSPGVGDDVHEALKGNTGGGVETPPRRKQQPAAHASTRRKQQPAAHASTFRERITIAILCAFAAQLALRAGGNLARGDQGISRALQNSASAIAARSEEVMPGYMDACESGFAGVQDRAAEVLFGSGHTWYDHSRLDDIRS